MDETEPITVVSLVMAVPGNIVAPGAWADAKTIMDYAEQLDAERAEMERQIATARQIERALRRTIAGQQKRIGSLERRNALLRGLLERRNGKRHWPY